MRQTRCALVTGVQTCALPIYGIAVFRLPRLPQAVMHLYHELMKVNAALAADIKAVAEQVHQHGLAPSYPAPHIEPPWRRWRTAQHCPKRAPASSEEHMSELQSIMRLSYAVYCLKTKTTSGKTYNTNNV